MSEYVYNESWEDQVYKNILVEENNALVPRVKGQIVSKGVQSASKSKGKLGKIAAGAAAVGTAAYGAKKLYDKHQAKKAEKEAKDESCFYDTDDNGNTIVYDESNYIILDKNTEEVLEAGFFDKNGDAYKFVEE